MPVMVQTRNVPDEWRRKLKARAAAAGMSLSEYALRELR
jgi:plasmid stability protein